ncbi:MAG: hypothetical protein ACTSR1_00215 [Candidatus Heimdallarchaeota archaeon]
MPNKILRDYVISNPVTNLVSLKAVVTTSFVTQKNIIIMSDIGLFYYDSTSTATPDDESVIKPNDVTLPDPGRWLIVGEKTSLNYVANAGWISGGEITDNLDGTIDVAAGSGYFRVSDSETADIVKLEWSETTNISLVDASENYVYVDRNGGSPIISTTTTGSLVKDNEWTKWEISEIFREGTELHISPHKQISTDVGRLLQIFLYDDSELKRTRGIKIGSTGTRNVTVSDGKLWTKLNPILFPAFDSSGSDTFDRYYDNGSGGFIKQTGITQCDNGFYDDGSGSLGALNTNWYSWQYFWAEADGAIVSRYGENQYSSAGASLLDEKPSNNPERISDHATHIGRIRVRNGSDDVLVQSVFETQYSANVESNHAELSNLTYAASGHRTTFQRKTTVQSTDPTVNDDYNEGYDVGQWWINSLLEYIFVLTDSTVGAAVWKQIPKMDDIANPDVKYFIATASQNVFTLDVVPAYPTKNILCRNGQVSKYGTDYTISGTILTWIGATLINNDKIDFYYSYDNAVSSGTFKIIEEIAFDYSTTNQGYRVRPAAGTASMWGTFLIPRDFNSIIDLSIDLSISAGAAGPDKSIDITTRYCAYGEDLNTHSESDIGTLHDFSGLTDSRTKIDITSVITGVSAGDRVGIDMDNNLIGGYIYVFGIEGTYI